MEQNSIKRSKSWAKEERVNNKDKIYFINDDELDQGRECIWKNATTTVKLRYKDANYHINSHNRKNVKYQ